jgi:hypothetical protein
VTVGRYLQQAIQIFLLLLVIRMVDLVQTLACLIFAEDLQDTMTIWVQLKVLLVVILQGFMEQRKDKQRLRMDFKTHLVAYL